MFVVDQSCSMDTEATALANAFSIFINEIENETQGWQIGVATLFDGCFNSGVLTANTPTYQTLFSAAVTLGTHHARTEALLELADVALGETGAGQCNANFLRPGALLHIIVVSDESEQSGVAWDTWLSSYEAYVTDPSLVKVSAVADLNTACGDGSGAAGYIDAAGATSGLTLDICTAAWSSQVGQLAQASLTAIADFTLTGTPDPATITVMVDGVPTTDWTYDPMSNAVQVGGTLAGGEVVDVSYSSWGVCP